MPRHSPAKMSFSFIRPGTRVAAITSSSLRRTLIAPWARGSSASRSAAFPGFAAESGAAKSYLAATQDLSADSRFFTGMPPGAIASCGVFPRGERMAAWRLCRDADRDRAPVGAAGRTLGRKNRSDPLQSFLLHSRRRQIARHPRLPAVCSIHTICKPGSSLCAIAMPGRCGRRQNTKRCWRANWRICVPPMSLIHLNTEEAEAFGALLPEKRHALIFPSVRPMPLGRGNDIIIVASANYPNFLGLKWFLSEVMPRAGAVPVRIVGNINEMVRRRAPLLYSDTSRFSSASPAILPEPMRGRRRSCFRPRPATASRSRRSRRFRAGCRSSPRRPPSAAWGSIPRTLKNVILAEDAPAFAAAVRQLAATPPRCDDDASDPSDTRLLYERLFTAAAYKETLAALVAPLLVRTDVLQT